MRGSGTTSPARARYRLTVAADTRDLVVVLQVPGDGVRPGVQALPGQVLAQPTISSTASALIAAGEVFGRRDRGSNAASPSAR